MGEMATSLGVEAVYDIIEVAIVDGYNGELVREYNKRKEA